jgi:sugar phosphate isomerase/epimerase
MDLCLYTDSVERLGFEEALDLAARTGCKAIEIAAGGQSSAPHMRIGELLADAGKRRDFAAAFTSRGLRIAALNCSAWPLHPVAGQEHVELIRDVLHLASELGVSKIVTMSGNPGDGPGATTINWIWYPWPADATALLDRQWAEAIPLWERLGAEAEQNGVSKIAFELHPLHLVYNVPTLLRMRDAVGPVIGANVDPSHMFWQQMDPLAVVRVLGPAVHHVHLKDTEVVPDQVALAGVLDSRPFTNPAERAWIFRTVGRSHDRAWWASFIGALRDAGYDDVLSIENEDILQPPVEGVEEAAALILPLLG